MSRFRAPTRSSCPIRSSITIRTRSNGATSPSTPSSPACRRRPRRAGSPAGSPTGRVLDRARVDAVLVRSHLELQRLHEEFRVGERVAEVIRPMIDVARACRGRCASSTGLRAGVRRPLAGCPRRAGPDVELMGADCNPACHRRARSRTGSRSPAGSSPATPSPCGAGDDHLDRSAAPLPGPSWRGLRAAGRRRWPRPLRHQPEPHRPDGVVDFSRRGCANRWPDSTACAR